MEPIMQRMRRKYRAAPGNSSQSSAYDEMIKVETLSPDAVLDLCFFYRILSTKKEGKNIFPCQIAVDIKKKEDFLFFAAINLTWPDKLYRTAHKQGYFLTQSGFSLSLYIHTASIILPRFLLIHSSSDGIRLHYLLKAQSQCSSHPTKGRAKFQILQRKL